MTDAATGLILAGAIYLANLAWTVLMRHHLVGRYLGGAFSALSLVWGTAMTGAIVLYGGRLVHASLPGGWGSASAPSASVVASGVALYSLGWISLLVDSRCHRLPDSVTLAMGVEAMLIAIVTPLLIVTDSSWVGGIVVSSALWWAPLALGWRVGHVGRGDVKIAPVVGALLGTTSVAIAVVGLLLAYGSVATGALILKMRGRAATSRLAFGPYLVGGAMVAWAIGALGPLVPPLLGL